MLDPTQTIFDLVLARPVVWPGGDDPHAVHLWWRLIGGDTGGRVVQVYVDGELHDAAGDATGEPTQREVWLWLDRSAPRQIELLAVDPREAWRPRPELLRGVSPRTRPRAEVRLVRHESLPVEARVEVWVGGERVHDSPLWDAGAHRGGFGALFGLGGFGTDAATGPGLGEGQLGLGPLGADGEAWTWRSDVLPPGEHEVELRLTRAGEPLTATTRRLLIDRLPEPGPQPRLWYRPDPALAGMKPLNNRQDAKGPEVRREDRGF